MKNILITGAKSYIGESFKQYLEQWPGQYKVEVMETKGLKPQAEMFLGVDAIFCVTGIAHIKETVNDRRLYYDVNRDLVVDIAKAAKDAGVKQFVLLSSMSVYGMEIGHITKATSPHPLNAYGDSKYQADEMIKELEEEDFIFTCLRPPMVYGKNCKGNYQRLRDFALKSPFFLNYQNQRSMIYIGNLCEFVKEAIEQQKRGLYFPQNDEYTNTCRMVELIAQEHGKKIKLIRVPDWAIKFAKLNIVKKVFGNLTYEPIDLVSKYGFEESIKLTEKKNT